MRTPRPGDLFHSRNSEFILVVSMHSDFDEDLWWPDRVFLVLHSFDGDDLRLLYYSEGVLLNRYTWVRIGEAT